MDLATLGFVALACVGFLLFLSFAAKQANEISGEKIPSGDEPAAERRTKCGRRCYSAYVAGTSHNGPSGPRALHLEERQGWR